LLSHHTATAQCSQPKGCGHFFFVPTQYGQGTEQKPEGIYFYAFNIKKILNLPNFLWKTFGGFKKNIILKQ
jgi:hypothetical protein